MRRTFAGPSIRRERLAKSEVMCIFQLPFRNSYSLNGAGSTAGLLFAMCRASARGLPSDGTRMRRPQSCLATTRCLPESRHTSSFLESSAESSSGYSVLTHSSSDCGVLLCSAAGSCGCTRHLWECTRYRGPRGWGTPLCSLCRGSPTWGGPPAHLLCIVYLHVPRTTACLNGNLLLCLQYL